MTNRNKNSSLALVHNDSMTKVDRYGWTMVDRPGEFVMLRKEELQINHADYQRDQVDSKVQRIASEWSWIGCGALIVALRNNAYWVIDGGHRALAAMRRSDIDSLPCLVFEIESVQQEAKGFMLSNVNRKPITATERHRSMVTAGDTVAQKIEELTRQAGRRVGKSSDAYTMNCVTTLGRCLLIDEETTREIWPLVILLCDGHPMYGNLIKGIFYVQRALVEGQSLTQDPWRSRLRKMGVETIIGHIQKALALHGKGGERILGLGVLAAVNRQARVNQARFRNTDDTA